MRIYTLLCLTMILALNPAVSQTLPIPTTSSNKPEYLTTGRSIAVMRKIGNEFLGNEQIKSLLLEDYVQASARKIDLQLSKSIHFILSKSNQINAFATEPPIIVIHAGMIDFIENNSEFYGLLAHEMAHIKQQHIKRVIAKAKGHSIAGLLAIGTALIVSPENAQAAAVASIWGISNNQVKFSRSLEHEADSIANELLTKNDINTQGQYTLFRKLDNPIYPYLSSHPSPSERAALLRIKSKNAIEINDNYWMFKTLVFLKQNAYPLNYKKQIMRQLATTTNPKDSLRYQFILLNYANHYQQRLDNEAKILQSLQAKLATGLTITENQMLLEGSLLDYMVSFMPEQLDPQQLLEAADTYPHAQSFLALITKYLLLAVPNRKLPISATLSNQLEQSTSAIVLNRLAKLAEKSTQTFSQYWLTAKAAQSEGQFLASLRLLTKIRKLIERKKIKVTFAQEKNLDNFENILRSQQKSYLQLIGK